MGQTAPNPATDPARWVAAHGDYLYRVAVRWVGDRSAAEDLVQDTLLAAFRGRHRFAGRSSERTWLAAILRRKTADWLRAAVRGRAGTDPGRSPFFTPAGKWRTAPGEWDQDHPGRELTRAEFRRVLEGCLDRLPPRQRQAFVLRHLDDRPAAAVGTTVGVTAGNLCVLLHRARLGLNRCLTVSWFEEDAGPNKGGRL